MCGAIAAPLGAAAPGLLKPVPVSYDGVSYVGLLVPGPAGLVEGAEAPPEVGTLTSWRIRGRRVTMPVPRGRKSRPTTKDGVGVQG